MANLDLKNNLDSFKEVFKDYHDNYTVIGGTACFLLMEEAGLDFRATKDIDMILLLEDGGEGFCEVFWNYIVAGGYTCGQKESEPRYYRFTKPREGYPSQIELFSRRLDFRIDSRIIPIHISDDISNLSAIVLDDDFYEFMKHGRRVVDEISVLDSGYIIPFKMFAWLNNTDYRNSGGHVNTDDIKKHKNDVFRMMALISPDDRITTEGNVRKAVESFLDRISREEIAKEFLPDGRTMEEMLNIIREIYL